MVRWPIHSKSVEFVLDLLNLFGQLNVQQLRLNLPVQVLCHALLDEIGWELEFVDDVDVIDDENHGNEGEQIVEFQIEVL